MSHVACYLWEWTLGWLNYALNNYWMHNWLINESIIGYRRTSCFAFLKKSWRERFHLSWAHISYNKRGIINLKLYFKCQACDGCLHMTFLLPSLNAISNYPSPSAYSLWPKGYQVKIKQDIWTSDFINISWSR